MESTNKSKQAKTLRAFLFAPVPSSASSSIMSEGEPFAGLDASELRSLYERVQSLQDAVMLQNAGGYGRDGPQDAVRFKYLLAEIIKLMEARMGGPHVRSLEDDNALAYVPFRSSRSLV